MSNVKVGQIVLLHEVQEYLDQDDLDPETNTPKRKTRNRGCVPAIVTAVAENGTATVHAFPARGSTHSGVQVLADHGDAAGFIASPVDDPAPAAGKGAAKAADVAELRAQIEELRAQIAAAQAPPAS